MVNPQSTSKTFALILVILLFVTTCVLVNQDASQEGQVDAATSYDIQEGYQIDLSNLPKDGVYTSTTLDSLKVYVEIEKDGAQLGLNDFYLQSDSGESLRAGDNTITIISSQDGSTIGSFQVTAQQVAVSKVTPVLDPGFNIYSSYSTRLDLIKQHLTVTVDFNDGTKIILDGSDSKDAAQFGLSGDFGIYSQSNMNSFTVTYTYDGVPAAGTFTTTVLKQTYEKIVAVYEQNRGGDGNVIPVDIDENFNRFYNNFGKLTVYGYYSETERVELLPSMYNLSGSLYPDAGDENVATITVNYNGEGELSTTFTVIVQTKTPVSLDDPDDWSIYYNAEDLFDEGSVVIDVIYEDGSSRELAPGDFKIIYQDGKTAADGGYLHFGDTHVTLEYTENGATVKKELSVTVYKTTIEEPSFNTNPATFEEHTWWDRTMIGFDDSVMKIVVTRADGKTADYQFTENGDGTWTFSAMNAGVYTIAVNLTSQDYSWANTDKLEFEWTIYRISISPAISIEDWTYDSEPNSPVVSGNPGGAQPVFYYWGTGNDGSTIIEGNATTIVPAVAGNWNVYAVVPESDNYFGNTTPTVSFTIDRKEVDPANVAIKDFVYDGSKHRIDISTTEYKVTSELCGPDVGTYDATVEMSKDYAYNHQWTNGGSTATVKWNIVKAPVTAPSIKDDYSIKYNGQFHQYTEAINVPPESVKLISVSGTESAENHGTYSTVFSLQNPGNYRWAGEGGDSKPITVPWTIDAAEVDLPSIAGTWTYSEDSNGVAEQKTLRFDDSYKGLIEITCSDGNVTVNGITLTATQAGEYSLTLSLADTKNYVWSDTKNTNDRDELTWNIAKAANSVTKVTVGSTGLVYLQDDDRTYSAEAEFGEVMYMFSRTENGEYAVIEEPMGAGDWYVKAFVTGNTNYASAESANATHFYIDKAENTVSIQKYTTTYTYGDTIPEPGYTADYGTGIVFQHSSETGGTFDREMPKNVGTWYIRAYIAESDNFKEGISNEVALTIDPFSIPYPEFTYPTEDGDPFVYDGDSKTPTVSLGVSVYPPGETMADALVYTLTTQDGAGEYTIYFTPGDNYQWDSGNREVYPLTWEITKQSVILGTFERSQEYEQGQAFVPAIPVNDSLYTIGAIPEAIDRNEYTVEITLVDPENYMWVLNGQMKDDKTTPWDSINGTVMTIGFEVTNTQYTITITQEDWVYAQDDVPSPVPYPSVQEDEIQTAIGNPDLHRYEYMTSAGETLDGRPTDVGDYKVRIYVSNTQNYEDVYSEYVSFKITPATIAIGTVSGFTEDYNGTSYLVKNLATLNATAKNPSENEITWKFSTSLDGEFTEYLPLTNAGVYTVYYTASAPNHSTVEANADRYFTVTIEKMALTVQIGSDNIPYTGDVPDSDRLVAGIGYDVISGTPVEDEDLGIELSLMLGSAGVGEYVVKGNSTNTNYSIIFIEGKVTITAVDIPAPTLTIKEGTNLVYNNIAYAVKDYIEGLPAKTLEGDEITWTFSDSADGVFSENFTVKSANEEGHTIYVRGTAANHNPFASESYMVTLPVQKRTLNVSIGDSEVQYGDDPVYKTPEISNFAENENAISLGLQITPSSNYVKGGSDANEVFFITLAVTGNEGLENYDVVTKDDAKLIVIPRQITVIIDDKESEFGDELADLTYDRAEGSTLVSDDNLDDLVKVGFENGVEPNDYKAGGYRIVGTDVDGDNYHVTFVGSGDSSRDYGIYMITKVSVSIDFTNFTDTTYSGYAKQVEYSTTPADAKSSTTIEYYRLASESDEIGKEVGQVIDAGRYRAVVTVNDNYLIEGRSSLTFEIEKADYETFYGVEVKFEDLTTPYNGDAQYPTLTVPEERHGLEWSYKTGTDGATDYTGSPVKVEITFTLTENSGNIDAPDDMTAYVTIQKREVVVNWETPKSVVYDGTAQTVLAYYNDVDGNKQYLVTTPYSEDSHFAESGGVFKDYLDRGYNFTASFKEDDSGSSNYTLDTGTVREHYNIAKRQVSVISVDAERQYGYDNPAFTWEYYNTTYMFVDSDGHEIAEGTDIGFGYNCDAASNSNVGDYPIWIFNTTNLDTRNYAIDFNNESEEVGKLTIAPREVVITFEEQSLSYTGTKPDFDWKAYEAPSDSIASVGANPNIRLDISDDTGEWNVGDYLVSIQWDNRDNYNVTSEGEKYFHITLATFTAQLGCDDFEDFTYNGETYDVVGYLDRTASIGGVTWTYGLSADSLGENVYFGDAGEWTIHYKATAENYEPVTGSVTFTIKTATNEFQGFTPTDDEGWIYLGDPREILVPTDIFGNKAEYTICRVTEDGETPVTELNKDSYAGIYRIDYYVESDVSDRQPASGDTVYNYLRIEGSYTVEIQRKPVSANWENPSMQYDGSILENKITIKEYMSFTDDVTEGVQTMTDGKTMTMHATNKGEYYVVVKLKDDNYCWEDLTDPEERLFEVKWIIAEGGNGWVVTLQESGFTGGTYNGNAIIPAGVTAQVGTVRFVYSSVGGTDLDDYTSVPFVNAGEYYVIAIVDPTENHIGLTSEPLAYTITKASVDKPTMNGAYDSDGQLHDGGFTYNGGSWTISLVYGMNSDKVLVEGDTAIDAGKYRATVSLPNGNYKWAGTDDGAEDSSDPFSIEWEILRAVVQTPGYPSGEDGHLSFDPESSSQTYPFVHDNNVWVSGDYGSGYGTYTATFEIRDPTNYMWDDSLELEGGNYQLTWYIDRLPVHIPSIVENGVYNPAGMTNVITGFDPEIMGVNTGSLAVSSDNTDPENPVVTLIAIQASPSVWTPTIMSGRTAPAKTSPSTGASPRSNSPLRRVPTCSRMTATSTRTNPADTMGSPTSCISTTT